MATRAHTLPASERFAPRMLWLAGLGLAAVTRREAANAAASATAAATAWGERAVGFAVDAGAVARGGALTLRERVVPAACELGMDVEARLAPLLAAFGIARPASGSRARKPRRAAAKQPARRQPRKAASGKARAAR